jgi:2-oxo-4-hydroxy-4-carboxy-5-ureidoimidazoline decarboxylase
MPVTLAELNRLDRVQFVAALRGIYEHSPWIPEQAWPRRPFATIDELHAAMAAVVARAGRARQLSLIRAHPELAVKGYDRGGVIAEFARRIDNDLDQEFAECLRQIDKIARLRLKMEIANTSSASGSER